MRQPTLTIVTPSYNQGEFIRATIESVLAQDYPQLEYIVMDGGSTDQTAAIAAEYSGRLTWISEKDRGQAHAINKGFRMAKGEIVTWLNSDDILLPGAATRAVQAFASAPPTTGAIYGEGYRMDREGRITGRFPATEPFNLWKLVYLSDYVLQQSTFFRRAALEEIGWLDEKLHYALDWDVLIRLGKRFGLHYVAEEFGVLREYAEAKSFAGGKARVNEIREVLERHTRLKRAPGYWTYGLQTRQDSWKQRLEQQSPKWLRAPAVLASFFIYVATAGAIMLILRHAQGLYQDRWASDRLRWMVPEGAGEVAMRGRVPDDPRLSGQALTVISDGRQLGRWPVGPGEFTVRFERPAGGSGPFAFEVRAARYRRPRFGSELSFRRMGWILENIFWSVPDSSVAT
ncbi:MAG TPA: glycosyltransferase family 2 protein [Bryobacteraceae bacterium]|nr:glycosyltransferase family 2 protein [Bryobacteraceae bacterium]